MPLRGISSADKRSLIRSVDPPAEEVVETVGASEDSLSPTGGGGGGGGGGATGLTGGLTTEPKAPVAVENPDNLIVGFDGSTGSGVTTSSEAGSGTAVEMGCTSGTGGMNGFLGTAGT